MIVARTARLVLRRWEPGDAAAFAAINADPVVTRFVGGPLTRAASDAFLDRMLAHWAEHGYGRCAVEMDGVLLGYAGVGPHPLGLGCPEIGWRLAAHCWGRGLGTEAARAARDLAFGEWGLPRLVAVMHPDNAATLGVARNLGMTFRREATADDGQRVVVHELRRA